MRCASFGDGFQRSTDQGAVIAGSGEKEKVISTHRTSSNAWCRKECEELDGVKRVSARIEEVCCCGLFNVVDQPPCRLVPHIYCCSDAFSLLGFHKTTMSLSKF